MSRLFGTDGVRGLANRDITAELALDLSIAAAHVLGEADGRSPAARPRAVVGRDPRASGEFLSAAVVRRAGLGRGRRAQRRRAARRPPSPTSPPTWARPSASCSRRRTTPMPDNGIKFFAEGGHKLRRRRRGRDRARGSAQDWDRPRAPTSAASTRTGAGQARYVAHLLRPCRNRLDGLTVVIDCAHGAASAVSPEVFRLAGADVVEIGTDPDGLNINDGYGSTHLDRLRAAVVERGADLGIAHDGDADRCLAVDADGARGRRRPDHGDPRARAQGPRGCCARTPSSRPS